MPWGGCQRACDRTPAADTEGYGLQRHSLFAQFGKLRFGGMMKSYDSKRTFVGAVLIGMRKQAGLGMKAYRYGTSNHG